MALFGKRHEQPEQTAAPSVYTLLDSDARLLARASRYEFESPFLFFTLLDGELRSIREANFVQVVPPDKNLPPQMTRFAGYHDGIIALEPMRGAGSAVRKNFRVSAEFDSCAYPVSGVRAEIHAVDLSCGGIAFHSPYAFSPNEIFRIDIPLVSGKQIRLLAQALRARADPKEGTLYACRFINLSDDEEMLLRETLFALQLQSNQFQNR